MKVATRGALGIAALLVPCTLVCQNAKTYKHASDYQIAVLDGSLRVRTGTDVTLGKNMTDAKLDPGGQGFHMLHTDAGDYRVEAPVNKGITFVSALTADKYHPPQTFHNKWFLDNVQPGTKVLFAAECARPSRKHPNDVVRCTFYFPDPDSTEHEYATTGDFTPFMAGDGSNTAKTAGTLCGTGKLNREVEVQLCAPLRPAPMPAVVPPAPAPAAAPAEAVAEAKPLPAVATPPVIVATAPAPVAAAVPAPIARSFAPAAAPAPAAAAAAPTQTALPVAPAVPAHEAPTASSASSALATVSIVVDSTAKGADIEVDGKFAGNTPSTITVTQGQHTIVVKKNGYALWSRSLNVTGNGVHVSADLSAQSTRSSRARTQVRCHPVTACGTADPGTWAGEAAK